MKILFVAWDDKSFMERGLIIYLKDLARNLSQRGHLVFQFSSGNYDWRLHPYLKRSFDNEIKQYEFINSPNIPLRHKGRPYQDIHQPQIEKYFEKVLREIKPNIVVFREFEGLCASLITIAKRFNSTKTVCMLGNYSALCPEIDLYNFAKEKNCEDYDQGRACIECNITDGEKGIFSRFVDLFFQNQKGPIIKARLMKQFFIKKFISMIGKFRNKQTQNVDSKTYRFRREEFIKIINNCDLVIAISKRQKEIFIKHGMDSDKIRVVSMAMSHQDRISFKPLFHNGTPITFGYLGRINKLKGCEILFQAFMELKNSKQCRLFLFGKVDSNFFQKNRQLFNSKNNNIFYKGNYSLNELNNILNKIDVGIIPSIWEECYGHVGPEFLSASIPIIGSKIGGITDYLIDGKNGLLFSPANVDDLVGKINAIISDPYLITKMKSNIVRKSRYLEHIVLMENIFLNVCNNKIDRINRLNLTSWFQ